MMQILLIAASASAAAVEPNSEGVYDCSTSFVRGVWGDTTLDLTSQNITYFNSSIWQNCAAATKITFGANKVETLSSGAFAGLSKLQTISFNSLTGVGDIAACRFTNKCSSDRGALRVVEAGAFDGLPDLHTVDLNNNIIERIQQGMFQNRSGVTTLGMRYNQITTIEAGAFDGLTKMVKLDLSNLGGTDNQCSQNGPLTIEPFAFNGLDRLTSLKLNCNRPRVDGRGSIQPGAFEGLCSVASLEMMQCNISELLPGALSGLCNLDSLNLLNNAIEQIQAGMFGSDGPQVRNLTLSSNRISKIEVGAFGNRTELSALYLNSNVLVAVETSTFSALSMLKVLDLSRNKLASVHPGAFTGLSSLLILNLANNEIKIILPGFFDGLNKTALALLGSNQALGYIASVFFTGSAEQKYFGFLMDNNPSRCEMAWGSQLKPPVVVGAHFEESFFTCTPTTDIRSRARCAWNGYNLEGQNEYLVHTCTDNNCTTENLDTCVCPAGTYLRSNSATGILECERCSKGTNGSYSTTRGASQCILCKDDPGSSLAYTESAGSTNSSFCVEDPTAVAQARADAEAAESTALKIAVAAAVLTLVLLAVLAFGVLRMCHLKAEAADADLQVKEAIVRAQELEIEYYRDWRINSNHIQLEKRLAVGGEGEVWRASLQDIGIVAVKKSNGFGMTEGEAVWNEVEVAFLMHMVSECA